MFRDVPDRGGWRGRSRVQWTKELLGEGSATVYGSDKGKIPSILRLSGIYLQKRRTLRTRGLEGVLLGRVGNPV